MHFNTTSTMGRYKQTFRDLCNFFSQQKDKQRRRRFPVASVAAEPSSFYLREVTPPVVLWAGRRGGREISDPPWRGLWGEGAVLQHTLT